VSDTRHTFNLKCRCYIGWHFLYIILVFHVIFVAVFSLAYTCKFWIWQGIKVDDLETNHFVLVHGGGFGAWCWYKTIALLEESGYKVAAIDLTGSGVHSFDTNNITSLSQYVKPLTDFLEKLPEGNKVLIVLVCIYIYISIFNTKKARSHALDRPALLDQSQVVHVSTLRNLIQNTNLGH
jgi:hypothetical protein